MKKWLPLFLINKTVISLNKKEINFFIFMIQNDPKLLKPIRSQINEKFSHRISIETEKFYLLNFAASLFFRKNSSKKSPR